MSEKFVIKEASVTWSAVRSSGPGGQNVNKVATAVQLRFSLSESGLPANAVERFRTLFAAKLVDGNVLLIKVKRRPSAPSRPISGPPEAGLRS